MKSKCGHFWKVTEVRNILPNCRIVDCFLQCKQCRKNVSAVISISGGGEK